MLDAALDVRWVLLLEQVSNFCLRAYWDDPVGG